MQIGSDVECFLRNSSDQVINAAKHITHDKDNPYKKQKIKIYYDNILAEFNIPPCNDGREFITNITNGIYLLEKLASPYKVDLTAAAIIDQDVLQDANAKESGCEDEYNAYTLMVNTEPKNFIKNSSVRTSGGHLHIGSIGDEILLDPIIKPLFVYMLDLFLGLTSVAIDNDLSQVDRRKVFGKAGSFRPKNYGIEYRVLSSWWIGKPEYTALVYSLTDFVYNEMIEKIWEKFWTITIDDKISYNCFGYDVNLIKDAINNCNKFEANRLLGFIFNFMPNDLVEQINDAKKLASHANCMRG